MVAGHGAEEYREAVCKLEELDGLEVEKLDGEQLAKALQLRYLMDSQGG